MRKSVRICKICRTDPSDILITIASVVTFLHTHSDLHQFQDVGKTCPEKDTTGFGKWLDSLSKKQDISYTCMCVLTADLITWTSQIYLFGLLRLPCNVFIWPFVLCVGMHLYMCIFVHVIDRCAAPRPPPPSPSPRIQWRHFQWYWNPHYKPKTVWCLPRVYNGNNLYTDDKTVSSWWRKMFPFDDLRHQMETFSALLVLCVGNSPVTGEFPAQRPVTQSFDGFFDLRLNKRLSKQSRGWWFETPSRSLWRHCNVSEKRARCDV